MAARGSNKPPPPLAASLVASSQFDKAAYSAYEKVKAERDALKESEAVYRRRNEALEQEKEDLLKSYQNIYGENKVLRSKVEHGPDAQRIRGFREEIRRLNEKVDVLKSQIALLEGERGDTVKKLNVTSEEKRRLEDAYKMERSLHMDKRTDLEKENEELKVKVDKLESQNKEYSFRMQKCIEETDGMTDRFKQVKVENMKLETKFRKKKDEIDEELRETKSTNNEMAKEIIQLKMKLAKQESELHSAQLDYAAAQKQIDWQTKELEVFQTQTTNLKRNVKIKDREFYRLEDELKSAESMIDAAQSYGFDAVMQERKSLRRKEKLHMKRIEDLEVQVEELSRENTILEKDLGDTRMKLENLMLENRNLEYAHGALKRRIQILEEANVELDKQGQFLLKSKKGFLVTMGNQDVKHAEKEKQSLQHQLNCLEDENRKMEKLIEALTNKPYRRTRDDVSLYTSRRNVRLATGHRSSRQPPAAYSSKSSRSRQPQSLPDIY